MWQRFEYHIDFGLWSYRILKPSQGQSKTKLIRNLPSSPAAMFPPSSIGPHPAAAAAAAAAALFHHQQAAAAAAAAAGGSPSAMAAAVTAAAALSGHPHPLALHHHLVSETTFVAKYWTKLTYCYQINFLMSTIFRGQ